MDARHQCGTALCAIFVLAISSATAWGQNPLADRVLAGTGEDSPASSALSAATAAAPSPAANCCEENCGAACCGPRWTAAADYIILDRIGGTNQTLVAHVANYTVPDRLPGSSKFGDLFTTPGVEALNGNDLQPGFRGGEQIDVIRHGDSGYDLELSYFHIDGWQGDQTVTPSSATDCLIMHAPGHWLSPTTAQNGWMGWLQTNQTTTQGMAWQYASKLDNAECNVRWNPCPRVTMLAGFRWVRLSESLQGALSPPEVPEPPFWTTTTLNDLYGFQIGADGKLWERGRFSLNGRVKAGVYDNNAQQTSLISVIHKTLYPASDSTNHAAFVGETGLRAKYQLTPDIWLTAGYEVIWLEGVALAPGQIQETYSTTRYPDPSAVQALGVNCNSGVFYHGATAGVECTF